jgi:hypothetical protein
MKLKKRVVQKSRITFRKIAVAATISILVISSTIFIYLNIGSSTDSFAATAGDYRSIASGNWTDVSIWQT